MSIEKMRAEFEEWYGDRHDGFMPNSYDGEYDWADCQACWEAWQASRAALVIDVPDENDDRFWSLLDEPTADGNSHIFLEGTFTDAVHEAIEAAGVMVKS